ncbi:MAG TPA: hypothetical protein VNZ53_04950 [Steroidobacteraceae bacterium]|jgi:hypothetical protein|nr:hypothetical protein [Steroidobacteraceae bacterium]
MPLARYFSYVGGVLLALLFILDAFFPKVPADERASSNVPIIRIHSDRKWPERIVFDTSVPTIIPAQIASGEPSILPPGTSGDVAVKAREREAFAQMQPSDTKQAKSRRPEPKPQRKSRIARRYVPPNFTSAPPWQFGWFGQSPWRGG